MFTLINKIIKKFNSNLAEEENYSENDKYAIIENDENVIKNDNNVIKNDENVIKNNENVIKNDNNVIKNNENVIKNDENVIKNNENVIKNNENVIKNNENAIKNNENIIKKGENVENATESFGTSSKILIENTIENLSVENTIKSSNTSTKNDISKFNSTNNENWYLNVYNQMNNIEINKTNTIVSHKETEEEAITKKREVNEPIRENEINICVPNLDIESFDQRNNIDSLIEIYKEKDANTKETKELFNNKSNASQFFSNKLINTNEQPIMTKVFRNITNLGVNKFYETINNDVLVHNFNSDNYLYESWYTKCDYKRKILFENDPNKKNRKVKYKKNKSDIIKIPYNLYIDGVNCCDKAKIIEAIRNNTNIDTFNMSNTKFCKIDVFGNNYYKDQIPGIINNFDAIDKNNTKFYELEIKKCSEIDDKLFKMIKDCFSIKRSFVQDENFKPRKLIYNKSPMSNIYHELILKTYIEFINNMREFNSMKNTENSEVEINIKKISNYIREILCKKFITKNNVINNEINKLVNFDVVNQFPTIFIVPNFSHTTSILEKMIIRDNKVDIIDRVFIDIQMLFYSILCEFDFLNIYFIHIPECIKMYSIEYYDFVTGEILNLYSNMFMYKHKYIDIPIIEN